MLVRNGVVDLLATNYSVNQISSTFLGEGKFPLPLFSSHLVRPGNSSKNKNNKNNEKLILEKKFLVFVESHFPTYYVALRGNDVPVNLID